MSKLSKLKKIVVKPRVSLYNLNEKIQEMYDDKFLTLIGNEENPIKRKVYDCAYTVLAPTAATMAAGTALGLVVGCGVAALGVVPALQAIGYCTVGGFVLGTLAWPANLITEKACEEIEDYLDY